MKKRGGKIMADKIKVGVVGVKRETGSVQSLLNEYTRCLEEDKT